MNDQELMISFLDAIPSAELIPIGEDKAVQSDEVEMGMTYDELSVYGRLRKVEKCGPYSMFGKLIQEWGTCLSPLQVSFLDQVLWRYS
jgi:NAD+ synthase (glutamine-hydrolysing)